jgi:hypothetical protein
MRRETERKMGSSALDWRTYEIIAQSREKTWRQIENEEAKTKNVLGHAMDSNKLKRMFGTARMGGRP